ncbi:MAG: ribose 5-phosphate isomerase B [Acidobacteria bacterium RIFCSPLOWO2_02_FULL_61_28]|nr:MAG: ribose 5-phosphate isomerase B [Acidobacteria bacterium RIFCSPLOWO2_02_FULL_61_28]
MRIAVGADHAGFELKGPIVEQLKAAGHTPLDVGTHNDDPVDYPDLAREVADAILQGKADLGIMLCGSGVGGAIAANKFPGIRAGLCHDTFSAHQGREDDDVNVLCLGARVIGRALAQEIVKTFLGASFSGLPRHRRRVEKIEAIEKEFSGGNAKPSTRIPESQRTAPLKK